jgi:UDP-N-acetylmuramoylalanine--D-glutamate ligase
MIEIHTRRNQHLAVFGLGASGLAAAAALAESGAEILAWDDDDAARRRAQLAGIRLVDLYGCDWSGVDGLVLAPGVPLTHNPHQVVELAGRAGCPVLGDVELLFEACPAARFIAITGTNGKSTTTALVGHILDCAGLDVQVGGNLGPPALAFDPPQEGGVFVLELSSYQLDLTHDSGFDVAVLLNISPDHLDRHGDLDGYIAAKRRIFRDRTPGGDVRQTAIVGVDDSHGKSILAEIAARPGWRAVPISSGQRLDGGVFVIDGILFDSTGSAAVEVCGLNRIPTLPGAHNWQNAAAAFAAARAADVDAAVIAEALASYPGLPHRQEVVAEIGGVRYVNDSKATNGDAAARALACYDDVYWIAGGLAKQGGLDLVRPWLDRVRHAFLIGAAEQEFAAALAGAAAVSRCGDLAAALAAAHRMAQAEAPDGAVVLLSPACASFDQWRNFEARGDAFRAMVDDLAGGAA